MKSKILIKTAHFNRHCQSLNVNELPDANKPSPLGNALFTSLLLFANKLSSFEAPSGSSVVDPTLLRGVGHNLSISVKSGNLAEIKKLLGQALESIQDGDLSGNLYNEGLDLFHKTQQVQPTKSPLAKTWLDHYMAKQPNWLDNYMSQEKAKQEADEDMAGMKSSLETGSAVKV